MPRRQINNYRLTIFHDIWAKAGLDCYLDDEIQAVIYFVDETTATRASVSHEGIFWMYFSIDRLSDIMDMLRHENPVFVEMRNNYVTITTSLEPTGELEPPST